MKQPGLRTLLLGSYFTAPVIMVGCAIFTYRWWVDGGQGIIGFLAIALFIASAKAMNSVRAYRQWRADWQAMSSPPQGKTTKHWRMIAANLLVLVGLPALFVYSTQTDAPAVLHAAVTPVSLISGLVAMALTAGRLLWLARPKKRAGRQQPTPLVSVAVTRPVVTVPTLREGYQRLPPYCQQLLKGRA